MKIIEVINSQQDELTHLRQQALNSEDIDQIRLDLQQKASVDDVKNTLDHVCNSVNDKISREELIDLLDDYVGKEAFEQEMNTKVDNHKFSTVIEDKISVTEFR